MEALIKQLVEANITQQAMNRDLLEEQHQQTVLLRVEISRLSAAGGMAASRSQVNPSSFILKLTDDDDIEAYLQTFERTASHEGWPPEQWAGLKAPFLSGTAQKTYQDITTEQANHYDEERNPASLWSHPD